LCFNAVCARSRTLRAVQRVGKGPMLPIYISNNFQNSSCPCAEVGVDRLDIASYRITDLNDLLVCIGETFVLSHRCNSGTTIRCTSCVHLLYRVGRQRWLLLVCSGIWPATQGTKALSQSRIPTQSNGYIEAGSGLLMKH
jgi:phage FluMu protein Com